jgi:hypothetical protein
MHKDYIYINDKLFEPNGIQVSNLELDPKSAEYAACSFCLNEYAILFRSAKITPTKNGQFVTLLKRNSEGITAPFYIIDDIDFAIICTRTPTHFGAFIFPKFILHQKGILADDEKDGKRGFRVYPPWDIVENKQAKQTQEWQLKYFLEMPNDSTSENDYTIYAYNVEKFKLEFQ